MRLQEVSLDEFSLKVREMDQNIVVYGAGVIGKVTLPTFLERE